MNVSQMLTGYAFGTIKPAIRRPEVKPEARSELVAATLHACRATRTANAEKRRAEIAEMVKDGASYNDVDDRFGVCLETVKSDIAKIRGRLISHKLAAEFLATAPKVPARKFGLNATTVDKQARILEAIGSSTPDIYELSERFHMSRTCMYGYVLRLEKEGLIVRTDDRPYRLAAIDTKN